MKGAGFGGWVACQEQEQGWEAGVWVAEDDEGDDPMPGRRQG